MANRVRFHPLVADDLAAATGWYDAISVPLGNRFRRALNDRFDAVEQRPETFGYVMDDRRATRVRNFPYLVLFECDEQLTHILGVYHTASDPLKWRLR